MFELLPQSSGKVVGVKIKGKATHTDYQAFVPKLEEAIKKHGKIRVLFEMVDVSGFEMSAVWDDLKFEAKHCRDIERCAVVGDKKWEEWMVKIAKPFYSAGVKYFDIKQLDDAWKWIKEGA